MPKRKKSSNDYDHLLRKMKKLARKILRARRSSSESCYSTRSDIIEQQEELQDGEYIEFQSIADGDQQLVEEPLSMEPIPSSSATADATDVSAPTAIRVIDGNAETESRLDAQITLTSDMDTPLEEEVMAILGDDPSVQKSYGPDIHKDLAVRLEHLVTTGLTKEICKELQNKYLPPTNSPLVDAPALNAELEAAVSDTVAKRDKGIEIKQKQVANAISCIGQATTYLLSQKEKNPTLLKLLMDANRILCDVQYLDSLTRRNFILATLEKDMKEQLQSTKIDTMLFGKNFAETLKTAKAISKSGADLKSTPNVKSLVRKTKPSTSMNLNWKGPPPKGRPTASGTQRTQQPASQKHQGTRNHSHR